MLVSWSTTVTFATSANATLNVSVVVHRSCTVTRTNADSDVLVKCAPGGAPAVVQADHEVAARTDDSLSTSVEPAGSTSDGRLHYVTIQF
jgi:hypothetical protein